MTFKLPEGWKMVRLGEICKENSGMYGINESAVEHKPNLYRYLRITDIKDDGTIDESKKVSVNINKDEESKYLLNKNDIVVARTGASAGRNYFYTGEEDPMIFAGFLIKFALDESKVIPEYIKYYCQSTGYRDWVKAISTGSTRPNINAKMYANMEINLPPSNQQRLLVDTLSALDKKIELNNKINENLEQQAQAIFKHWFIDFEFPDENGNPYKSSGGKMIESELGMIPKGWRVGEFKDIIKFRNGYGFKSRETSDNPIKKGYKIFKMGDIKVGGGLNPDKTKSWITHEYLIENKLVKYLAKKGDLLMCMTDMKNNMKLLGHTALMPIDDEFVVNQRVGHISENNDIGISYPYLYVLTNNDQFIDDLRGRSNSGVQVNLTTAAITETKVVIGPKEINIKFDEIVKLMIEKIFKLEQQNKTLEQIRDILLPKLMSGEVRIPLD